MLRSSFWTCTEHMLCIICLNSCTLSNIPPSLYTRVYLNTKLVIIFFIQSLYGLTPGFVLGCILKYMRVWFGTFSWNWRPLVCQLVMQLIGIKGLIFHHSDMQKRSSRNSLGVKPNLQFWSVRKYFVASVVTAGAGLHARSKCRYTFSVL